MELKDKVTLITGATSGIGKATAVRFVREGARVAVAGIEDAEGRAVERQLRELANEIRAGDAMYVHADVSQSRDIQRVVSAALERWGRLDVVVNNAAIMTYQPLVDLPDEDWDRVMGVNLRAVFLLAKYGVPHMRPGSAIVNVSSIHAVATEAGTAPYSASKGGMETLTRAMAVELFERKIRVNAVRLGAVDTEMLWENPQVKSGEEHVAPMEVGEPEEIAEGILFLASDRASFVSGAVLNIDGGRLPILGSHAR